MRTNWYEKAKQDHKRGEYHTPDTWDAAIEYQKGFHAAARERRQALQVPAQDPWQV